MTYRRVFIYICLLQFIAPLSVRAEILFSEIMYDPKGTQAGREWIEIYNNSAAPVDLSNWKFFENDTKHALTLSSGNVILPSSGYAVIADDAISFMNDFPSFGGTLFDSSFSLSDKGEMLSVGEYFPKDKVFNISDTVSYDPSLGAKGDGNSMQKNSSGGWVAAAPTPGAELPVPPAETTTTSSAESSSTSETVSAGASSQPLDSRWPVEPQVFADTGRDKIVIVGAATRFEGKAYGLKMEPLENARYLWNFGDGGTGEGKTVFHTYRHPGDYLVVLEAASGYFSGEDQLKVHAESSPIFVSAITDNSGYFIEVTNSSNTDIDISSWWLSLGLPAATSMVQAGDKKFEIPKNTFVMGGKKLVFPNETTGLPVGEGSVPELLYPNGTTASRYGESKKNIIYGTANNPPAEPKVSVAIGSSLPTDDFSQISSVENNIAAAAAALPKKSNSNYLWLLGVAGIAIIAIGGILLVRRFETPEDETEKLAREIEIVE